LFNQTNCLIDVSATGDNATSGAVSLAAFVDVSAVDDVTLLAYAEG
jgi:hypothetical protein